MLSALIAAISGEPACELHEHCENETCVGRQVGYAASSSPNGQTTIEKRVPELTAESSLTLRDATWVAEQGFNEFAYRSLPAGMIRLLNVKSANFIADVFECDMVTVSLDESADFNALSYCWGSNVFDREVICNGQKLAVTRALEESLKVYRRSLDVFGKRPLWVDAVCINQSDTAERSAQVCLMRTIYRTATSVIVDLGDAENTMPLGFHIMNKLSEAHRLANGYRPQPPVFYNAIFDALPPLDHPGWTYYMNIFSSPWFRRTWILQEIALARDAQVRYGRFTFSWGNFVDAFTFFTKSNFHVHLTPKSPSHCATTGILSLINILDICKLTQKPEEWPNPLLSALHISRNQKVTDPRDKVIGILGFIPDGATRANIPYIADYSLSISEVYHRLAVYFVKSGAAIDVLPHAGLQRRAAVRDSLLPSWAPDWTAQNRSFGSLPLVKFRPSSYSAATMTEARITLEDSGIPLGNREPPRVLSIMGWCIDSIKYLSDAHPPHIATEEVTHADIQKAFLAWHGSVRKCLDEARDQVIAHGNTDDAFARTLLVNDVYSGRNATAMSKCIEDPAGCYARVIVDLGCGRHGRLTHTSYDGSEDSTYAQQAFAAAPCRRFAITAGGHFCLVPAASTVGDGIAIFSGFATPFIIRQLSPNGVDQRMSCVNAHLIGDAYIHEMMDGESLSRGGDLQEIRLY